MKTISQADFQSACAVLVRVDDYQSNGSRANAAGSLAHSGRYCAQLEEGNILLFDHIPFDLPEADIEFMVAQRAGDSRIHKNISYRPSQDLLRGFSANRKEDVARMHSIMRDYSTEVTRFLADLLAPYAESWSLDFASYRPLEEERRNLPFHKRNDLLHVDAFPTRPTRGARILRIFTNINPQAPRRWITAERFNQLAARYAVDAGLKQYAAESLSTGGSLRRRATHLIRALGIRLPDRSAYDRFMLRFHDYLKEHSEFQQGGSKVHLEFPPRATWIVFTDAVPHAALSGQFALEHTYIVPTRVLLAPEKAPISVLESLCGCPLSV